MKLVSSKDTIAFLSQSAPRAWVQRMLRCMVIDGELDVYFSAGRIEPYTHAFNLLLPLREKAGEFSGPKMDAVIRDTFEEHLAEKLVGKEGQETIDDEPLDWIPSDGHESIDIGWLFFADETDWDDGTIKVPWVPTDRDTADIFFPTKEFFYSEFSGADYRATFSGMSFDYHRIEMLLPSAELGGPSRSGASTSQARSRVGRPPKWDWEGALAHVIAKAQTPDGLPTGSGAQARIEEIICEWFIGETGEAPSSSQIRERAAKIIRSLERPKRAQM